MAKPKKMKQADKLKLKEGVYIINNFLMDLVGIHPDKTGNMRTDNDGSVLCVRGKHIKLFDPDKTNKDYVPFRPLYNSKMMLICFNLFTMGLKAEGRYIKSIEYGPGGKKDKIWLQCEEQGYDDLLRSKPYYNDSLRYMDIMCQLNETLPPIDLEELDNLMSGNV